VRKADNLPPYCAVVTKSGSLNFSEPCGPVQACYGAALPFFFTVNIVILHYKDQVVDGVQRNKYLRFVRMIPHTWYAVGTKRDLNVKCTSSSSVADVVSVSGFVLLPQAVPLPLTCDTGQPNPQLRPWR